jgi:hypothetical protein
MVFESLKDRIFLLCPVPDLPTPLTLPPLTSLNEPDLSPFLMPYNLGINTPFKYMR